MRLLVVGGSGLLGRELSRTALAQGHAVTATRHHGKADDSGTAWRTVDIRDRSAAAALLAAVRPDWVINAAYQQADWQTTADGAAHVALAAAAVGAHLVHVSSEAVFSGNGPASYDETAQPDPGTPYGAAKAAAETAVRAIDPRAVVARTSLIIGNGISAHEQSAHEQLVHRLARAPYSGVLFTDDVHCPIHVADLAQALLELAAAPFAGTHHLAGTDAVSRYELGVLIARRDGLDAAALRTGLREDVGLPGTVHIRLDTTATQSRLSTRLRGVQEFLRMTVKL